MLFTYGSSGRQVRNTVCYVMQNGRRHGLRIPDTHGGIDPFSSAWYFDGWRTNRWRAGVDPPPDGAVDRGDSTVWRARIVARV